MGTNRAATSAQESNSPASMEGAGSNHDGRSSSGSMGGTSRRSQVYTRQPPPVATVGARSVPWFFTLKDRASGMTIRWRQLAVYDWSATGKAVTYLPPSTGFAPSTE